MEIQITEKYKAKVIPHNYQLIEYLEGGKEVRNIQTGEMQVQESGWKAQSIFYANLPGLVRYIARLEADNAQDLNEWLDRFTQVINEFEQRNK